MSKEKDMLGAAVRALVSVPEDRLGLVQDFALKMSQVNTGEEWASQGKSFLRKEPCWTNANVTQVTEPNPAPSLLEFIATTAVNAIAGTFIAKEKFVINTTSDAPVKISSLGNNFAEWFLSGDDKIEDPITNQTLRYHKLRKATVDGPIIAELGGEVKAEAALSEMFSLMEKQKHGEDGCLLNNGWANIFYIRDQNSVLRTVCVYWDDGGWSVYAGSVGYSVGWGGGCQVFSHNSDLEPLGTLAPA